ncbi:MAG: hypothetical protein AAGB11_06790 [Pseudomonadota bacterium]
MENVLTNPRHERFAQALASGQTADAGYSPNGGSASRLHGNACIRGRVTEIQSATAKAVGITRERLIQMCIEVFENAAQAGNAHSAQIAAIREIGVLTGLRVEKPFAEDKAQDLTKEQRDAVVAAALIADR